MLEYDRKELGVVLKEARKRAGLSQGDVSSRVGYTSPQFISNIERGVSVASLPLLGKLIKIYGMPPKRISDVILKSQEQLLRSKLKCN